MRPINQQINQTKKNPKRKHRKNVLWLKKWDSVEENVHEIARTIRTCTL